MYGVFASYMKTALRSRRDLPIYLPLNLTTKNGKCQFFWNNDGPLNNSPIFG